jgi:ComF family protein
MNFKNFEKILDILFPHRCPSCNIIVASNDFCKNCLKQIKFFDFLVCSRCFKRILKLNDICHNEKFILGAVTNYNDFIQKAIWNLKFNFVREVANPLSKLLIEYFKTIQNYYQINLKDFIVVPIPLSNKRLKQRGFNQSELIAKNFANYFNLPLELNLLLRLKHSQPQSEIKSFEKRELNVKNCFYINNKIINKNIILIDDVFTSGATMKEAVKTLKEHHAKKIISLVISRVL